LIFFIAVESPHKNSQALLEKQQLIKEARTLEAVEATDKLYPMGEFDDLDESLKNNTATNSKINFTTDSSNLKAKSTGNLPQADSSINNGPSLASRSQVNVKQKMVIGPTGVHTTPGINEPSTKRPQYSMHPSPLKRDTTHLGLTSKTRGSAAAQPKLGREPNFTAQRFTMRSPTRGTERGGLTTTTPVMTKSDLAIASTSGGGEQVTDSPRKVVANETAANLKIGASIVDMYESKGGIDSICFFQFTYFLFIVIWFASIVILFIYKAPGV
jgi:hypothetical protein